LGGWLFLPCHFKYIPSYMFKSVECGAGGHWLVRMEWRPAGWSVRLPLLVFPCTIKNRSSVLAGYLPRRYTHERSPNLVLIGLDLE